jgi:polyhydroxyalkanoate synthesis regulator phasin
MRDAWRAYLELALGVTEASKKKAQKVAKKLAGRGGATAAQIQAIAEDLVATGTANREAITKLVHAEVDRALGAVGLAKADEIADLNKRVQELERELRDAHARATAAEATAGVARPPVSVTTAGPDETPEPVADATPAAPLRPLASVPAGDAVADTASRTVARSTVAKKTVAKKAVAPKTVAKKATAGKAAPKKAGDLTAVPVPGTPEPAQDGASAAAPAKRAARKTAPRKVAKKATPGTP